MNNWFAFSGLLFDSKSMLPPNMVAVWVLYRFQVAAESILNACKHNNINLVTLCSSPVAQSGPAAGHLCPSLGSVLDPRCSHRRAFSFRTHCNCLPSFFQDLAAIHDWHLVWRDMRNVHGIYVVATCSSVPNCTCVAKHLVAGCDLWLAFRSCSTPRMTW